MLTKQVPEDLLAPAGAGTVVPTGVVLHGVLLYLGPDQAGRSMGKKVPDLCQLHLSDAQTSLAPGQGAPGPALPTR